MNQTTGLKIDLLQLHRYPADFACIKIDQTNKNLTRATFMVQITASLNKVKK